MHITSQENSIETLREELANMHHKHTNAEGLFRGEVERGDKFQRWYKELEDPFLQQKSELHKLKLEVIKYEQRYGFIDVNKMHEHTELYKSQAIDATTRANVLEGDLFEIRERILDQI